MAKIEEIYIDAQHKKFFNHYINKCGCGDSYHKALIYCLGIDGNTRKHIHDIYNFDTGCIKTECLRESWQTGSSKKVVRLAFNLYTDKVISVYDYDYDSHDAQLEECRCYSVSGIMCCAYMKYFFEAVRIRYSDYLQ